MAHETSPSGGMTGFDLTTFFAGRTRAWGIFEDRFGTLRRRFTVEMEGHWHDGVFLLEERFRYDTGDEEVRVWRVTPEAGGRFSATSEDCIGTLQGISRADAVDMRYRFRLKLQSLSIAVNFSDRIYRMGAGIAVNRATMSKWGITLGELSLFFERADEPARLPLSVAAE